MAPLAEVAYRDPSMIQSMFTAHDNGTYTVRFYYNGQPEIFTVDNQLPRSGLGVENPYLGVNVGHLAGTRGEGVH